MQTGKTKTEKNKLRKSHGLLWRRLIGLLYNTLNCIHVLWPPPQSSIRIGSLGLSRGFMWRRHAWWCAKHFAQMLDISYFDSLWRTTQSNFTTDKIAWWLCFMSRLPLYSEMMQILEAIYLYSSFQTKTVLCCRVCLPCECNRLSQFTKCLDFFQTALLCVAN